MHRVVAAVALIKMVYCVICRVYTQVSIGCYDIHIRKFGHNNGNASGQRRYGAPRLVFILMQIAWV